MLVLYLVLTWSCHTSVRQTTCLTLRGWCVLACRQGTTPCIAHFKTTGHSWHLCAAWTASYQRTSTAQILSGGSTLCWPTREQPSCSSPRCAWWCARCFALPEAQPGGLPACAQSEHYWYHRTACCQLFSSCTPLQSATDKSCSDGSSPPVIDKGSMRVQPGLNDAQLRAVLASAEVLNFKASWLVLCTPYLWVGGEGGGGGG